MKRSLYLFPLMAATALTLTLAACDDPAQDTQQPGQATTGTMTTSDAATTQQAAVMHAEGAQAYATAEGQKTGVIFLTLHNPQAEADKLTGAKTDVADSVEIHQSYVDEADGTMQMRKVGDIEVLPGQQVDLKPDGYHLMLTDLNAPLMQGSTFNVTLEFDNAADVTIPVTVTAPGNMGAGASMDHSGHSMNDTSAMGTGQGTMPADTGTMTAGQTSATTTDSTAGTAPSGMTDGTATTAPSTTTGVEPTPMQDPVTGGNPAETTTPTDEEFSPEELSSTPTNNVNPAQ